MKWRCIVFLAVSAFSSGLNIVQHFLVTFFVKKFHPDSLHCGTLVICQNTVPLLGKLQTLSRDKGQAIFSGQAIKYFLYFSCTLKLWEPVAMCATLPPGRRADQYFHLMAFCKSKFQHLLVVSQTCCTFLGNICLKFQAKSMFPRKR